MKMILKFKNKIVLIHKWNLITFKYSEGDIFHIFESENRIYNTLKKHRTKQEAMDEICNRIHKDYLK